MFDKKIRLKQTDNLKVLVVDDNAVNRDLAIRHLEKLKIMGDSASGGKAALDSLKRTPYALVLLDIKMPDMDGYQTAKEIRKMSGPVSKIPIIALTAYGNFQDKQNALASGINDFVFKPLESDNLKSILAKWWPVKKIKIKSHSSFKIGE